MIVIIVITNWFVKSQTRNLSLKFFFFILLTNVFMCTVIKVVFNVDRLK